MAKLSLIIVYHFSVDFIYFGRAYNPLSILLVSIIFLLQIQYVMSAIYMYLHLFLCLLCYAYY